MAEFKVNEIEKKWQKYWEENDSYKAEVDPSRPKFYALDMFPYPSGAGLHVGHPLGYIASDIVSRYKTLQGYNVLHPMGFDAFGLPAEQYAIQTGQHPAITTEENIKRYKEQLKNIGFAFDWDKEVRTSDPKFYKWTQWIFMQLFDSWYNKKSDKAEPISSLIAEFEKSGNTNIEAQCDEDTPSFSAGDWNDYSEKEQQNLLLKYRLAYLANTTVNWCPALGTVLSNDEVKDGYSERGGHPVERKNMMQWMMRITAYAERLLQGLNKIDWPEPLKEMQRNWIGKSVGAEVDFKVASPPSPLSGGEGGKSYLTANSKKWKILKEFARDNRKSPTPEEDELWQRLRNKKIGYKIRRQHAIGDFIADFVCLPKKIVIEVDGDYHLQNKEYDKARTEYLNELGFEVIRFKNEEVKEDPFEVAEIIKDKLDSTPSPQEERGTGGEVIRIFTTRIDTIFGATFLVLAPESELVEKLTTDEQKKEVEEYVQVAKNRSERERMMDVKHVTGVFTGAYAEHPFSREKLPIWIADYVLAGYGTGAVMAVPAGDQRDYDFAKHFDLPIVKINDAMNIDKEADPTRAGKIINSDFLNGLSPEEAIKKGTEELEKRGIGEAKVNYRMRDAIFTRQRYWGEPLPVYYKDGIPYLMDESELPLTLPEVDKYLPTEDGAPPLGRAENWETKEGYPIELSTMPGWAGSSWYFFRYMDAHNEEAFVSKEAQEYWGNVDLYIGGSEHATGHLLYSRFWTKFLYDFGLVTVDEPFKKLINQGMIQGRSNFVYRIKNTNTYVSYNLRNEYDTIPLHVDVNIVYNDELNIEKFKAWRPENKDAEFILEDGKYICGHEVEKMSKSKYNVVNPDDIIERYGADTLRLYEMFLGPLEQFKPWNTNGIDGVSKFLRKLWNLFHDEQGDFFVSQDEPTKEELKTLHKTIKKATEDIERYSFNTSVSEFMICVNELTALKCDKAKILSELVVVISPYAPHITEELWHKLGNVESITKATFPKFNESYLVEREHEYPVSVNGKMRAKMSFPLDMPKEDIEKQVLASEIIQKWMEGKEPKKVIIVPNKIVNVVV